MVGLLFVGKKTGIWDKYALIIYVGITKNIFGHPEILLVKA